YLKTIESLERATISQLEKILYVSKSSISITVSKLVKEGYVRRYKCEDESDGRKIFLELTPEGTKALNEVNERVAERFARFYETLDEERKKDLQTAIDSFYKLFDNKED
ncbi:MAG: MarR family winged helix-turn-helix transcriptional regulator, partial [Anaerotignaceae bacterium]